MAKFHKDEHHRKRDPDEKRESYRRWRDPHGRVEEEYDKNMALVTKSGLTRDEIRFLANNIDDIKKGRFTDESLAIILKYGLDREDVLNLVEAHNKTLTLAWAKYKPHPKDYF